MKKIKPFLIHCIAVWNFSSPHPLRQSLVLYATDVGHWLVLVPSRSDRAPVVNRSFRKCCRSWPALLHTVRASHPRQSMLSSLSPSLRMRRHMRPNELDPPPGARTHCTQPAAADVPCEEESNTWAPEILRLFVTLSDPSKSWPMRPAKERISETKQKKELVKLKINLKKAPQDTI